MHQAVEARQPLRRAENLGGQRPPLDPAGRVEDPAAEFAHHVIIRLSAGRQHGVAQFVGLDQQAAIVPQDLADKRLPAGQSAR